MFIIIYLSLLICTLSEVTKEFNSLIFRFLWNGNDKVSKLSTYVLYDQGGLKMLDFDNMVKALRLSWLKWIVNPDYFDSGSHILIVFWWRGVIFYSVQLQYQPINNLHNFLSRTTNFKELQHFSMDRSANKPCLHSFQYEVWNSILYTNELLCKIGYTSNPNCSFCHQTTETISHIFFDCSFSTSFWNEICDKILKF